MQLKRYNIQNIFARKILYAWIINTFFQDNRHEQYDILNGQDSAYCRNKYAKYTVDNIQTVKCLNYIDISVFLFSITDLLREEESISNVKDKYISRTSLSTILSVFSNLKFCFENSFEVFMNSPLQLNTIVS